MLSAISEILEQECESESEERELEGALGENESTESSYILEQV
jgi:hypothetical protein